MVIFKKKKLTKENLKKKAQTCSIQGTVKLGAKPRYKQRGDVEVIAKKENYLVVNISRMGVFEILQDGSDVSAFATVQWAGSVKKTKMVKKPNVSEFVYFHIPVEESIRNDQSKLTDYLNEELETKSEIIVNVWADIGKPNLENLGACRICLANLHSMKFEDKQFVDERTKQKINF